MYCNFQLTPQALFTTNTAWFDPPAFNPQARQLLKILEQERKEDGEAMYIKKCTHKGHFSCHSDFDPEDTLR